MASAANTPCARSKSNLGCLLYFAQSGALDHGLTIRASADVLDLLNFSNLRRRLAYTTAYLDSDKLLDVLLVVSVTVRYASPS